MIKEIQETITNRKNKSNTTSSADSQSLPTTMNWFVKQSLEKRREFLKLDENRRNNMRGYIASDNQVFQK
jgi:hypothetical protein